MKNNSIKHAIKIVTVMVVFFTFMVSCKKEVAPITDKEYRAIAWNYLNAATKATVNQKWEDAPVTKPSLESTELVSVTFRTTQDALLGPIIVYISIKSNTAISIGPRF